MSEVLLAGYGREGRMAVAAWSLPPAPLSP